MLTVLLKKIEHKLRNWHAKYEQMNRKRKLYDKSIGKENENKSKKKTLQVGANGNWVYTTSQYSKMLLNKYNSKYKIGFFLIP